MKKNGVLGAALVLSFGIACTGSPEFDIVLEGGRVMDPASGLDSILYVGIAGDRIAAI